MPQDLLADGFVDLCIDTSLNFFAGKPCITVEGPSDGTATVDTLVTVQGQNAIATKFGDSVLAAMLNKVFDTCPTGAQIYAVPRAGSGTAAEHTLTFTGPATSAGRVQLYLGDGDWLVDVYIPDGSTATEIAALVDAEIPDEMPFTHAAALGVITFTAVNAGDIGNYFTALYNWTEFDNIAPDGVAMAVANSVAGVGAPAAVDWGTLMGGCCCDVFVTAYDDVDIQEALRLYLEGAWSCDTPQCFGHGYVYNCGTLGVVLAKATNSAELNRVDCCGTEASMPYNRLAAQAALRVCSVVESPEISIQGRTFGVLSAIKEPQQCSACRTYDEQVSLDVAGFNISGQLNGGSGAFTNPYIYNDITNYLRDDLGRDNATFRATFSRFLVKATAIEIADMLQTSFNGLGMFTKNTSIKQGTFGTNPRLMLAAIRTWAKGQIGELFSEFDNIDEDIQLASDMDTATPCTGVPGKMHLNFRYRPPVRVSQIVVTMQPELFTNCDR